MEKQFQAGQSPEQFWVTKKKKENLESSSGEVHMNEESVDDMPNCLRKIAILKNF
mgnify:CR=1 FL=1